MAAVATMSSPKGAPHYWTQVHCHRENATLLASVEKSFGTIKSTTSDPTFKLGLDEPKKLQYTFDRSKEASFADYVALFLRTSLPNSPAGSPVGRPALPIVDVCLDGVTKAELGEFQSLPAPFSNLFVKQDRPGSPTGQMALDVTAIWSHIANWYATQLEADEVELPKKVAHCWLLAKVIQRMIKTLRDELPTGNQSIQALQSAIRSLAKSNQPVAVKLIRMKFDDAEVQQYFADYNTLCGGPDGARILRRVIILEWLLMAECLVVTFMRHCDGIIRDFEAALEAELQSTRK